MIVMMMACVVVIVIKKKIRIRIYKNAALSVLQRDSKLAQKKFMCGCCDRGLWGAVFYNKNVTIITKFVTNITGLLLEKQW